MARVIFQRANLLDGTNPAKPDTTVVVQDGRITRVATEAVSAEPGDRVIDLAGKSLMPGMYTCHFHAEYDELFGSQMETLWLGTERPPGVWMCIAVRSARLALLSGVTGVVGAGCVGNNDAELAMAIDEGITEGPRYFPCGQHLNAIGGEWPGGKYWFRAENTGVESFASGPERFREAVRRQVRQGARMIKIYPSGGHGVHVSRSTRNLSHDELVATVDAAHERGAKVRAHVTFKERILECIEAGVDCIDHGDELDAEVIAAMVEHGTYFLPSMLYSKRMYESFEETGDRAMVNAHKPGFDNLRQMLPEANHAGVKIVTGDDFGIAPMPHALGAYAQELSLYVQDVEVKPLDVLRWATRNGAELTERLDVLGTIDEGKIADIIVVDGDPSSDITVLEDPGANLKAVMKDGVFYKDEL